MKYPKSEPYQRSRHRAALHAWVVAATAVASIGMPAAVKAMGRDTEQVTTDRGVLHPAEAAQRVAEAWWDALRRADVSDARSMMRLPGDDAAELDALDEVAALSDWLIESGVPVELVANEQSGHWALSAWRLGDDPLLEPVTLYHPSADGLSVGIADSLVGDTSGWQVVPQGIKDPALSPLYNADYTELEGWFEKLA